MPISYAAQKGNMIIIYNERGLQTGTIYAGLGRRDGLQGFTGSIVSVRHGATIITYDEKGRQLSTIVVT